MRPSKDLDTLARECEAAFSQRFRRASEILAAAPGRVNLIGEHIDYNHGFALPMAIERHTVCAAALNHTRTITIATHDLNESARIDLDTPLTPLPGAWQGYVVGVIAGFQSLGVDIPGFDALLLSSVPVGGGLSSSAALEVSLATALESIAGVTLEAQQKALLCQAAENHYAGVPCGIMDQFTSVMGAKDHALLIDCVSRSVSPVPFASDDVTILITNSGVRHDLAENAYTTRQLECRSALEKLGETSWRDVSLETIDSSTTMNEIEGRRARHIVTEISRTTRAADALSHNDWEAFGKFMRESHASLHDDFEVSCEELDHLADCLNSCDGVYGARMTGGGFGGCTVALVRSDVAEAVSAEVHEAYRDATGIEAESFTTRPADGAALLLPPR